MTCKKRTQAEKKLLSSHNNKPFIVWWTTYLFYLWGRGEGGCWWWSLAEIMVLWVGFVVLLPLRAGCEQGMVVKTASNCLPSIIIVWESGPSTPFPIYLCILLSRHPTIILLVPEKLQKLYFTRLLFPLRPTAKWIIYLSFPYIHLTISFVFWLKKKPATQAYLEDTDQT